jgi:putative acyl-CoA dehydrogenase
MNSFLQDPPHLTNTYKSNRWLKAYLKHKLPPEIFATVDADLHNLGDKCAGPYLALARTAEREKPQHIAFDAWGKRIDEVRVSQAWIELQNIAAREGLISIGYKRKQGEFSRVYQFAKLYLFHPSSAFFTCPLAMADGAAKVMETFGSTPEHREALAHLTAETPEEFWTSGQWMTEKTGGSDVSHTGTVARHENGKIRLYGDKWFSSATTSQIALALGRYADSPEGSRGLTLFLVHTYSQPGQLNNIRVQRLKEKLGTWALPTAELSLEGTIASQVGDKDHGVKTVASMLNITRLYNSVCSVGQSTRALEMLYDYSSRREVFGQKLAQQVLHYSTFAEEELKNLASFLLTFELVHLLGKEECKTASASDSEVLRLMTPVCKLFTARAAIQISSEVIEGFGGVGYCEDSGLPVHLRDSQVFPIWEGATNVLSLDMVRVVQKQGFKALQADITQRLKSIRNADLEFHARGLEASVMEFEKSLQMWTRTTQEAQLASSRSLAFFLGRLYAFTLLLNWADAESEANRQTLLPWVEQFGESFVGHWLPVSDEECGRRQRIWRERLKS